MTWQKLWNLKLKTCSGQCNDICVLSPTKCFKCTGSAAHLGAVQTDDAVHVACAVIEVGDRDSMLAGWQPVLLGVGVDLEDMSPGAVDGLLSKRNEEEVVNFFVP